MMQDYIAPAYTGGVELTLIILALVSFAAFVFGAFL